MNFISLYGLKKVSLLVIFSLYLHQILQVGRVLVIDDNDNEQADPERNTCSEGV